MSFWRAELLKVIARLKSLGTAADADTGTSGTTVPFLDGANTWSGAQIFNGGGNAVKIGAGYNGAQIVEIGYTGGVNNASGIDFHTSATAVDYDVRLLASGNTGVAGAGLLQILATAGLQPSGPLDLSVSTSGQIKFPATQNASAGANDLDDYEEGTFTPTVLFGGASVGVTYGTRTTGYIKAGRLVIAFFDMTLTSKGSSVGAAQIGGLPFSVTGVTGTASFSFYQNLAGLTGALTGSCGATAIDLRQHAAATVGGVADTNFTNTTRLIGVVVYQTST